MNSHYHIDNPTLYTSGYLVANPKGYTKHYYAGSERVFSAIGLGGLGNINRPLRTHIHRYWEHKTIILREKMSKMIDVCLGHRYHTQITLQILYNMKDATPGTMLRYFYHSDHLGSSSWITDAKGFAIQHLHYLPFGEDWVEQRTTSWCAPYTFSAKEKDQETGYSYVTSLRSVSSLRFGKVRTSSLCTHSLRRFGARYYDSDLSIWLSVDPMSDKYPNITPYAYCANNPVIYIDPDGREKIPSLNPKTNEYYARVRKAIRNYTRNVGVIHLWAHGNSQNIVTYNESEKKDVSLSTPYKVKLFLENNSAVYRNHNKEGEESKTSILVLHSCETGQPDGIAQQISKELNLLVVAPTDILTQTSNADGTNVEEIVRNDGGWAIYYKGEQMETFNGKTKPLFDNPDKTIEKYEKMYQEKHSIQTQSMEEK